MRNMQVVLDANDSGALSISRKGAFATIQYSAVRDGLKTLPGKDPVIPEMMTTSEPRISLSRCGDAVICSCTKTIAIENDVQSDTENIVACGTEARTVVNSFLNKFFTKDGVE